MVVSCGSFGSAEVDEPSVADAGGPTRPGDAAASTPADGAQPAEDARVVEDAAGRGLVAFVTLLGATPPTTLAEADTRCTTDAAGRLSGKFVAWFSDNTTAAPAHLVDGQGRAVDGPWYRVDGARIVANRAALSNAAAVPLENAINVTAAGTTSSAPVWTATRADGTIGVRCPDGTNPTAGLAGNTDVQWTEQKAFATSCSDHLSLYCFQVE